ncbi:MAG: IscS subfamily cysteine desulfurase [Polyangiaceae bacterium]|nr:IscS subfamily cysteine desulfurase [Polyangiaceae bacterium]
MAVQLPIFMDNHSTTRVDPRVLEAMLPYFTDDFGNAASRTHAFGWKAEAAIEASRETIARFIGAESGREIVFTSGATEADNLAIKGIAEYYGAKGKHLVTSAIEHKAVLDSCKRLEKDGFSVTYLPVGKDGLVEPAAVEQAIRRDTILVSVMLANNEVGTVQSLEEIGKITRAKGVLFHTDAVQGIGKTPFDVRKMNVDLASLTAHKIYGPKGIGALYVRRSRPRVRLVAQMDGGGHERGNRSGTLNVPGAVGFAKALELYEREGAAENERILGLRQRLYDKLTGRLEKVELNGDWERRLPGNLNVSFSFVEGEAMMMAIKDVAVSSGSACTSASLEPSYVLRAMGLDEDLAHSSIRFGIGRFNTEEEVDYVAELVAAEVERLRAMSPLYEMYQEGIDLKSIQWSAH